MSRAGKYFILTAAMLFSPLLLLALPFVLRSRWGGKSKPLIGLVISDSWSAANHYLIWPYELALWWAGAKTVIVRPGMKAHRLEAVMRRAGGLLFSGGEDIHHSFYEHEQACRWPNLTRDRFEFSLLDRADRAGIPVLGICRGEQLLAVHYGGRLESHRECPELAEKHVPLSLFPKRHQVHITEGSKLYGILGRIGIKVNSLHSYNIADPGTMQVSAISEDKLVEAVELPGNRFVLGVQWHPELTVLADQHTREIFRAFVAAAQEFRHMPCQSKIQA